MLHLNLARGISALFRKVKGIEYGGQFSILEVIFTTFISKSIDWFLYEGNTGT